MLDQRPVGRAALGCGAAHRLGQRTRPLQIDRALIPPTHPNPQLRAPTRRRNNEQLLQIVETRTGREGAVKDDLGIDPFRSRGATITSLPDFRQMPMECGVDGNCPLYVW
jgi:hypothetical protein